MIDALIIIGEILLVWCLFLPVAAYVLIRVGAVTIEKIEREIPSPELAAMMVGASPELAELRRPVEHPLDRLARHCDLLIVEPSNEGDPRGQAAPRDVKPLLLDSAPPIRVLPDGPGGADREAASHATKGRR